MRKILSFFAFAAILLTFAACGGNEPEIKDFTIKVQALSDRVHIVITPRDEEATYLWRITNQASITNDEGGVEGYVAKVLKMSYNTLFQGGYILENGKVLDKPVENLEYEKDYVVVAVRVEKDETTEKGKVVGSIVTFELKTMPKNTLNGEFTVNAKGKKVHFAQSIRLKAGGYAYYTEQWRCIGSSSSSQQDLLSWNLAHVATPFTILEADEWYYLFRERPNAANLFAHATVNDVKGLIILPDNWEKPDGIDMHLDAELNLAWNEKEQSYKHSDPSFSAFEKNPYTEEEWKSLEFAGAVFLPAAGVNSGYGDTGKDTQGWYWSSTSKEGADTRAHAFSFGTNNVVLKDLSASSSEKTCCMCIRPVRVL